MKILFLDIETCPAISYTWGLFNQNISPDQVISPTSLLCFGYRWSGDDTTYFHYSEKRSGKEFDGMVRNAHRVLSQADAVCHYNGNSFDIPMLNTEFLRLGLPPPPPTPQIDLKKVVMSKFRMTSSKLAFVGPYLDIGEKVKHSGWELWIGCLANDPKAWETMETYNRQDVVLLEKLYYKLLPWIDGHPNVGLWMDADEEPKCPNCGSTKIQRRGLQRNTTQVYRRYVCASCGRWSRRRTAEKGRAVDIR